ncbi:hypothetical protein [Zunongwangia atlantica]|uniref:Uncharacterized protein n=1 Tax=Zunongwangia atlantica 22II14-10F7 TaxID=1185767 RepID=A0A1Y1T2Y1_9FLAO|nr:hypothetical protein [Zunongwangia atlantica]ORL45387.1 hypothetical protein IIF7_11213 [Zunongwangia atlantica 22II14-10F7]
MYNQLKNIAETNNFEFIYARRDFQNLNRGSADLEKIFLFLDPIQKNDQFDEYSNLLSTSYNGTFMLVKQSKFGDDYQVRFEETIRPLIEEKLNLITDSFGCSDLNIDSWNTTEIINLFNQNFDGVIVSYSISNEY